MSWNFLCADMFPYEDSKTVSVCLSVRLPVPREKKSPWLRQYQSYISNWYINGKVFTRTTTQKSKNWMFFQKSSKLNFDLCWRAEITLASSISALHWYLIHQWKGLHEYYSMETQKCEFHKIKVAKALKNSSMRRHFPSLCIGIA